MPIFVIIDHKNCMRTTAQ